MNVPSVNILILARTVNWAHKFAVAMGWDPADVYPVTDIRQLMTVNDKSIIFELAGWTTYIESLKTVNALADELINAKRRGVHVFYIESERLV